MEGKNPALPPSSPTPALPSHPSPLPGQGLPPAAGLPSLGARRQAGAGLSRCLGWELLLLGVRGVPLLTHRPLYSLSQLGPSPSATSLFSTSILCLIYHGLGFSFERGRSWLTRSRPDDAVFLKSSALFLKSGFSFR